MQLSPRPGVQLLRWSLADGVPLTGQQFQGRPTYFLYFSWGRRSAPWTVWVDFKVRPAHGLTGFNTAGVSGDKQSVCGRPRESCLLLAPWWAPGVNKEQCLRATGADVR